MILFPKKYSFVLFVSVGFTLCSCQVSDGVITVTRPLFHSLGKRLEKQLSDSQQHHTAVDRFRGEPILLQIAANEFYFDQNESKPFTFKSYRVLRNGKPWVIKPESMLTTGSSTPRLLWGVKGFGPFDFTKAAIIHDWLFEAHHRWCIAYYSRHEPGSTKLLIELKDYADPVLNEKLKSEGHPGASNTQLSIEDAADVMAECIDWEMRQCEHFATVLSGMLAEDAKLGAAHKLKMSDGERRGVQAIVNDLKQVKHDHTMLAQYHWSIRSFVARKFWNSGRDEGNPDTHASTDRTISLLKKRGLLDQAQKAGYLSSELINRIAKVEKKAEMFHQMELRVEEQLKTSSATSTLGRLFGGGDPAAPMPDAVPAPRSP